MLMFVKVPHRLWSVGNFFSAILMMSMMSCSIPVRCLVDRAVFFAA